MSFELEKISQKNIVVVYEALDISAISRDGVRKILDNAEPLLNDFPGALIVTYQPANIQCIFANRRVQITDFNSTLPTESLIPKLTKKVAALIKDGKLVAYGFNFIFNLSSPDVEQPGLFLKKIFLPESKVIEQKLTGTIKEFSPTFKFPRKDVIYTFTLVPEEAASTAQEGSKSSTIRAQCNVHYGKKKLPSAIKQLQEEFECQFDFLVDLSEKLLKG